MPSSNGNLKKKMYRYRLQSTIKNLEEKRKLFNIEISIILVKLKKIFPLIVSIIRFDLEDNNSLLSDVQNQQVFFSFSFFFFLPLELELF